MRIRIFGLVVALLVSPVSNAAQALFPYDPTPDWASFYVKTDTVVALCVVGTPTCGPAQVIKAGTEAAMLNCQITLTKPAGATGPMECRAVSVTTPPVVPPVVLPTGVTQIALSGGMFPQTPVAFYAVMGKKDYTGLSSVRQISAGAGSIFCNAAVFPDAVNGEACFSVPAPVVAAEQCYQDNDVSATKGVASSKNYKVSIVPAQANARWPYFISWFDPCLGKRTGNFFNEADAGKAFVANMVGLLGTGAQIGAWAKTQTSIPLNASESTWSKAQLLMEDAATPVFSVSLIAAGTRPYYAPNTAGTAIGKKLGDVAVKTPCDKTRRLGTTAYYFVPSVGGYAVCIAQ